MGKNRKENIPGNFDRNFGNMFKIVRGTFWPKLVKNRGFRPNGHHEEFRSVKNIQNQPVRCQKALTRTLFRKTHFGPKPVPLPTMGRKSCPIKFPTPTAFLSGGNFIGTDRSRNVRKLVGFSNLMTRLLFETLPLLPSADVP